jgi:hypothetical protein
LKTFKELREASNVVYNKKIGKYPVIISKTKSGFEANVDGDKLDDGFKTQSQALKAIKALIKEL